MKDKLLAALRIGMGGLFGYFGVLAVLNPAQQQAIWLANWVLGLPVVGHPGFIVLVGVLEVLVAAALILGVQVRYASLLSAGLLLGIVVNLASSGAWDLALRDAVLLLGCLVLASQEHRYALRP